MRKNFHSGHQNFVTSLSEIFDPQLYVAFVLTIVKHCFQNALTAATEAACLVLSIDQTIKNPRSGAPQSPDM